MTATYPPAEPIWCAGCGHFGVQATIAKALAELGISPEETLLLAGIGCSGTVQNNLGTYGYHALHGRVLPTATGAWLANPDLTVIAAGGDGDGYAIGMGHLIHTFRRNPSFTYVVMNNGTYGLTKGQDSPTHAGPEAADAVLLGLALPESTFVARGFTRRADQLHRLMVAALTHARSGRGFAFLEVLSPCVTYNDTYPDWGAHVLDLDDDPGHDPTDRAGAFAAAHRAVTEGRIPIGLIYHTPNAGLPPQRPVPATSSIEPLDHLSAYREILHPYEV